MPEFVWYEVFPPRGLDLTSVTSFVRVLSTRSRVGPLKLTPVVVFELRAEHRRIRWLLGMDRCLTGNLPGQLQASVHHLSVVRLDDVSRPEMQQASNVRVVGLSRPLRVDVAPAVSAGLLQALGTLGKHESAVVQWVVGPVQGRKVAPVPFDLAEVLGFKTPAPPEPGLQDAWRKKIAEPLYAVRGRVGVHTGSATRTRSLIYTLGGALSLANAPHTELRISHPSRGKARALRAVYRFGATWSGIVNSAELATLVGWPLDDVELPASVSQPLSRVPRKLLVSPDAVRPDQRILGQSLHPADGGRLVEMPVASAFHGLAVTGPTGSGKSTGLGHLILASAAAGHSVLVLEPRGDLIADVLARMPEHRRNDVVVIDPAEQDQVGFNPLAGPARDAERRADELVGLFRALYGSAIGPRSADVLLHSLLTVSRLDDGVLPDVPVLLANPGFRRRVLARVGDPLVLDPWWARFESKSEAEKAQITAPVNNKLTALLSRQSIRRMLGQATPKFSLDELFLERPKVVLVNLNRGAVGPEVSRLFGATMLQAAWLAAQRRARLPRAERFPVMWTVDEWQDYVAALDFAEVLSQCRGLNVGLTVANQSASQLTPELRAAVTSNARSRLAFRPSQDDVKALAAVFGSPVRAEDLERLRAFQACVRLLVDSQLTRPFTVKTLPLPPATTDTDTLRRSSRERYAVGGRELDAWLLERWRGGGSTANGGEAIGVKPRRQP